VKSDLNILIYTFLGQRNGVGKELDVVIPKYIDNCLMLVEKDNNRYACSSLIKGHLKEINYRFIPFPRDDDNYLCDVVYQRVYEYFSNWFRYKK